MLTRLRKFPACPAELESTEHGADEDHCFGADSVEFSDRNVLAGLRKRTRTTRQSVPHLSRGDPSISVSLKTVDARPNGQ